MYREIAGRVFKKPSTEITDEERQDGKVWFLMSLYSAGPKKISEETGMSYAEALQFYKDFHEGIPQIKLLSNPKPRSQRAMRFWTPGGIERAYEKRGYIKSLGGRHLHAEEHGEHKLLNKLIQGSAADVMIAAILRVHRYLRDHPEIESRMVSVIHDELIFDGPEHEIPLLHDVIPSLMIEPRVIEFVPIEIDHEVSTTTWAEKKSYDEWRKSVGESHSQSAAAADHHARDDGRRGALRGAAPRRR